MKRLPSIFSLTTIAILLVTTALAQHPQIHPLLQSSQYPTQKEGAMQTLEPTLINKTSSRQNDGGKSVTRTSSTQKLPLKYTLEKWVPQLHSFKTDQQKIVAFSDQEVFKIYTVNQSDTTAIDEVIMAPDFSNADILDAIFPGTLQNTFFLQTSFLRPVRGDFYQKFLEWTTREKIEGNFVTVKSLKDRKSFSSRFLMSSTFSTIRNCQLNAWYETVGSGRQENDLWLVEAGVLRKDCNTNAIIGEWKWTHTLDTNFNRIEAKDYTKENDAYRLDSHQKWEYNEQNLEKTYISVLENKKYEFEYDEFNGVLASGFEFNGSEWIQNYRTIKEITPGQEKTIVSYTGQRLESNSTWRDFYRETYHFDSQNRAILSSTEYYNTDTQQLEEEFYFERKFFQDDLVKEEYYRYRFNDAGTKLVYTYDDKNAVVLLETYACADRNSCINGVYEPRSKVEYSQGVIDTLDYQRSFAYTNGNWNKSDSLANLYDKDGDLIEMYTENFTADKRERIRFSYRQNGITGLEENEPINVMLYPNPTDRELKIEAQLSSYAVSIYDLNGKLLGRYINPEVIDISTLPAGMYLTRIESNGKQYRQKIMRIIID